MHPRRCNSTTGNGDLYEQGRLNEKNDKAQTALEG